MPMKMKTKNIIINIKVVLKAFAGVEISWYICSIKGMLIGLSVGVALVVAGVGVGIWNVKLSIVGCDSSSMFIMFDVSKCSASSIGLLKYFLLSGKTIEQDGFISM